MKGVSQIHRKFIKKEATADHAVLVSQIDWTDKTGEPIIQEARSMTFRPAPAPGIVKVDLETRLTAASGPVQLNGDPEHAGIQYRPANEVVTRETTYVFPKAEANPKKDRDYPWVGETYTLAGKRYSVVHMNHPDNPKNTIYSAYRDYGRFGAFFTKDLAKGETLVLKYRIAVAEGEMPPIPKIQKCWDDFAGVTTPTPVPETTVTGGAQKGRKKKG
jgi:hypothetical protein